jgi:hypothetical protein
MSTCFGMRTPYVATAVSLISRVFCTVYCFLIAFLSYGASGLGEEASRDFVVVFFGFCFGYGDVIMYFMFIVDSI